MISIIYRSACAIGTAMLLASGLSAAEWQTTNLPKSLVLTLRLGDSGLSYDVRHLHDGKETIVVEDSPLGIERRDQSFTSGLKFVSAGESKEFDETYQMLSGKTSTARSRGVERSFDFTNANGAALRIMARACDDGVAFAYRFPEETGAEITITRDASGFRMPEGRASLLPYDKVAIWAPAYEAFWLDEVAVGQSAPEGTRGWSFPALFNVRDHWVMLTEAGMDGTCFASHLEPVAPGCLYRMRLPEPEETYGVAPQEAAATLPWQSPWRVIMVGRTPATIVESTLVENLSPPNTISDTSWIKPGRVSWSWWSETSSPGDYDRLVPYIDLASELGWEYSLIDSGWHGMKNGDIWKLNEYAKSKGVGLIVWYNSGGKHSEVLDAGPRDLMHDPEIRAAEMAKLQKAGIKGIKVDFMQSDKQYVMKLYLDILRDAAKHHLVVDFHGSSIPRGWSRTYPNLLSMEAVAGAEQYWSEDFAAKAHHYHTIYPYTRNVIGSMDYTPVIFGNAPERKPHQTTNPHELATSVIFESGLQHFADNVANYRATPDFVRDFLRHVPAAWDETRWLGGSPGELVLLARRKGPDWYVAGLNGETNPKTANVPLTFLPGGKHSAEMIFDAKEARDFKFRKLELTATEKKLPVEMAGRGGFVIRISSSANADQRTQP